MITKDIPVYYRDAEEARVLLRAMRLPFTERRPFPWIVVVLSVTAEPKVLADVAARIERIEAESRLSSQAW